MYWTSEYTCAVVLMYTGCFLVALVALLQYGVRKRQIQVGTGSPSSGSPAETAAAKQAERTRESYLAETLFVLVLLTCLIPPFNVILGIALLVATHKIKK